MSPAIAANLAVERMNAHPTAGWPYNACWRLVVDQAHRLGIRTPRQMLEVLWQSAGQDAAIRAVGGDALAAWRAALASAGYQRVEIAALAPGDVALRMDHGIAAPALITGDGRRWAMAALGGACVLDVDAYTWVEGWRPQPDASDG